MATLKQLKTFIAVAECKKMSEAAKLLYISQPTVSQIISDLEKIYDVNLFERTPKELRITPAGEILLNSAREIVAIHETLNHNIKDICSKRILRVGGTFTVGNTILSTLVSMLKESYPDIDVQVYVNNTEHIEERFLNNKLDIALVEGIIRRDEIISEPALDDKLCLFCSKNHPFANKELISIEDLHHQIFVQREKGSGTRAIFENIMKTYNISYKTKWECCSNMAMIDAVHHNHGIAVLSERCVTNYLSSKDIVIKQMAEVSMNRYFFLCRHKHHPVTSQMNDFTKIVHQFKVMEME